MLKYLRSVLVGCLAIVGACTHTLPQTKPIPSPGAFVAQTRPDSIVEGTFEGTAMTQDGWVTVVVSKASLTFPPGAAERWRSLTVRSFVAADYRVGGWKAPAESAPVNVWQFLQFPRSAPTSGRMTMTFKDTLRFMAPIPPGTSLTTARIGFEIEWVTLFKDYGQTESNFGFSGPMRPPTP